MWYIGQKVVCVNDNWSYPETEGELYPRKDVIYTIRNIEQGLSLPQYVFLRFNELKNPVKQFKVRKCEVSFVETNFRPLEENKTDISVFKRIVDKLPSDKALV
jgi:hypothetical protein